MSPNATYLSGLGALACYQHVWGGGIPNQGAGGGDGEFATYDWVDGGNGAYGYSSGTWDNMMQDGYGGGITDGPGGELLSGDGQVVGYAWMTLSPMGGLSSPIPSGTVTSFQGGFTPSRDVPVGMDIWHCPGCAATWTNADITAHGLAIATGAVATTPFLVPTAAFAAEAAPGLAGQALYNPAVWQGANDFLEGYAPIGPFPATPAAFAGAVASSWDTIWNDVTRRW